MERRVSPAISFMSVAIAAALTVASCIGLERWQKSQHKMLLAAHEHDVAARKEQFDLREVKHQIDVHDTTVARQRRYQQEFMAALGGPVGAALKHPDLTILGMLRELARACTPQGSMSHVAVDRFTEFSILIELPRRETKASLAEIARDLLAHSAQYVDSIRFSHRSSVLAQLDRRAIESIPDWTKAAAADVERLLIQPEFSEPPTFVGAVGAPTEQHVQESQNLPEEVQRQKTVEERFRDAFKHADAQLRSALEQQMAAVDLASVRLIGDLDARRKILIEAERAAAEARRVLGNPVLEYERILEQQKLDPVYIRAATRTAAQTHSSSRAAAAKIFAALEERSICASEFLATMKRHFGAWTYQPFHDRIEFHDPAAQRDYTSAIKKFDAASRNVENAINEWARALNQNPQADRPTKRPAE